MPDIEIRETTVTPVADGAIVRLQISDQPLNPEFVPTFYLNLTVKLAEYAEPLLLAQFQAEALQKAKEVLRSIDGALLLEIRRNPHIDIQPKEKRRA